MPHKVLVVDDEPDMKELIGQLFSEKTRQQEWELMFAGNGHEALDRLRENPETCVVLLDLNMPVMDGFTFLEEIKKIPHRGLKVIVVTAYGDMPNIRRAMNLGAFDFITKPFDLLDLEKTIVKGIEQFGLIRALLKKSAEKDAIDKDIEIAADIQATMIPAAFCAHRQDIVIYARMLPARKIGGDFFDYFFIDAEQNRLAFFLGDVSGKGISAALYMAKCCTLLKATIKVEEEPAACLEKVNHLLVSGSDGRTYVTVIYGILDIGNGELHYSCGGHLPPRLITATGDTRELPAKQGIFLGIMEGQKYTSEKLQLSPGDTLFLYSDGVTDAADPAGEQFVEKNRLADYLKRAHRASPRDMIEGLLKDIQAFAAEEPQYDDITVLALRYK